MKLERWGAPAQVWLPGLLQVPWLVSKENQEADEGF